LHSDQQQQQQQIRGNTNKKIKQQDSSFQLLQIQQIFGIFGSATDQSQEQKRVIWLQLNPNNTTLLNFARLQ
jgi:hypothetical protein